jgi:hypothetical protein
MSVVSSLWASIQGDPLFMRRVNGWLTIFSIVMIPVSIFTGWIDSVTYVAALSLWALVPGHWSAWQAARVQSSKRRMPREGRRRTSPARSWSAWSRKRTWTRNRTRRRRRRGTTHVPIDRLRRSLTRRPTVIRGLTLPP